MKKVNLLSKSELKKVTGGGPPPDTPGGDASYCQNKGKGHVLCLDDGGSSGGYQEYFYACCISNEEAQPYCPATSAYACI